MWIDLIASIFLVTEQGPRKYYLGNDYTYYNGQDMWIYGSQTYAADTVSHVKLLYECLPKESTPSSVTDCHPKMDEYSTLGPDDHCKF